MDRLSAWEIVEEVCGLAGTVARVFKTLYDYYQNVKNAPEKSQELQDELYEISHIARNMKMLVAKSGRRGREKIVKDETVVRFEKMLDEIEKKITLPEGSISLQRLKWPFSQKENGEYIARIERFKTTLNLALSVYQSQQVADMPEMLHTLQTTAHAIKATTQQTHKNTVELNVALQDEKHLKILEWIYPGSFEARHNDISGRRSGSGEWFLNHETVKTWRESDKAEEAGVGKSFLSSFVIDSLKAGMDPQTEAVLFCYFDYTRQEDQALEKVAANFLKQLLCANNYIPKDVAAWYEECTKHSRNPDDFKSLLRLLDSCSSRFSKIYLVLDALDEYQHNQKKLVSFLSTLRDSKSTCYKIISTTRPHLQDLADDLKAIATFNIAPWNPDLELYINSRLEEEWEHDEELKSSIVQAITEQGEVTFLLARYQLDQILAEDDPQDALNALEKLPTDLSEAYSGIISRIEGKKGKTSESTYRILSWIYRALRPLQMRELVEALSIQKGNTNLDPKLFISAKVILRRCEGLVAHDKISDEVRFAHFTVFEFLEKHCRHKLMRSIDISKICLKYQIAIAGILAEFLATPERGEIYYAQDWRSPFMKKLLYHPFCQYATVYWSVHAKEEDGQELELVEELLTLHESPTVMKTLHTFCTFQLSTLQADCFYPDCEGWTVLHLIALNGLNRLCDTLFGIASNEEYAFPVHLSHLLDRVTSMAHFCKNNIDKACNQNGTALHFSATRDDDGVFRLLIQHGANMDMATGLYKNKAVHLAATCGSISKLELLLSAGADVSDRNWWEMTPLALAAEKGSHKCVQFLLDKGANPLHPDTRGNIALHEASCCQVETIRLLTEANPSSVNMQNNFGQTPLHHFVKSADSRLLQYLLSVPNIKISIQDMDGQTPLHLVSSLENVVLLLDAGADLTVVDAASNTPLDSALISGNTDVAKLLYRRTKSLASGNPEANVEETDFSPLDLLLSRTKEKPCNWRIYEAVAKVYLLEGDVSMAKQFLDRSYFIQSEWQPILPRLCLECFGPSPENGHRYQCFNCTPTGRRHQICLECFPLLSSYRRPVFFQDHNFIRIPSEDYPSSISSFIQELKDTGVEIPKERPPYDN